MFNVLSVATGLTVLWSLGQDAHAFDCKSSASSQPLCRVDLSRDPVGIVLKYGMYAAPETMFPGPYDCHPLGQEDYTPRCCAKNAVPVTPKGFKATPVDPATESDACSSP
ncbi:hypothetical protein PGT21_019244 [Puccinia graminis f. sp. tritici]|uniref:Hydrophobin n=1 Tax=Puccinia graminis f. sp. tritici TaxID=56615 RepID=A0A5B0P4I4_PUCGR|nr:hypothetical protein PGTUg99_029879 [Puccinia graminis f. sp. tritici]KAA1099747.1 hypothetical protein PGT21_019244 [Puccinia graminis f. sp. tritici]